MYHLARSRVSKSGTSPRAGKRSFHSRDFYFRIESEGRSLDVKKLIARVWVKIAGVLGIGVYVKLTNYKLK